MAAKFDKISIIATVIFFLSTGAGLCADTHQAKRLYWFIPDGMRADPQLFNIFKWAKEGRLPNIKKMMENGAYGYSVPVFPSHTPVNFATLLTGSYPKVHGVADGPMHVEGFPLDKPSLGGFSSVAKKVDPIWVTLEKQGKKVVLLSIPGSTPPELNEGITIRGRWGGWGADFPAINFEPEKTDTIKLGRERRLFFLGPELTQYVGIDKRGAIPQARLNAFGENIRADIGDKVTFYDGSDRNIASLRQGEWSKWIPVKLNWQGAGIDSRFKAVPIKLGNEGFFRIRFLYDNLNELIVKPSFVAGELLKGAGPMVDTVDNFPPQLIYYPEDKKTFLEEAEMSLDWHRRAAGFIFDKYRPDIFIHDIYTPNQMLTSRWWLADVEPASARYKEGSIEEKNAWQDIFWLYKKLDDIIGEAIKRADKDTLIVLSSDHGIIPLNKYVRINNLLAKEGLLKFKINPDTNEPLIDWHNSKAVFLKMDNIYINPKGLAGNYKRAAGKEYEELRNKIAGILAALKDGNGAGPVVRIVKYEDAQKFLDLPADRVGDLVIANSAGYGFYEEMTEDLEVFSEPLVGGYKQAVIPEEEKGMWTPFVIMGPGVEKNHEIKNPVRQIDQYPTIMELLGAEIPGFVEGSAISEIFAPGSFLQALNKSDISADKLKRFWLEKGSPGLLIGRDNKGRACRIEIIKPIEQAAAGKYIQDRQYVLKSLFKSIPAPYPGEITYSIQVPQELKPEIITLQAEAGARPVYILYSTDRLTYGAGSPDLIKYKGALTFIYDRDRKVLYIVEIFVPKEDFVREEALEIIKSFKVNSRGIS